MAVKSEYRYLPVHAVDRHYVGLDVGQSIDPSALCVIQHVVTPGDWTVDHDKAICRQAKTERFYVRYLERLRLGMPYPEQVQYVANLMQREPLCGATFALDYTGCGRPVADLFDRAGLRPHKILITAGNEVVRAGRDHHVPKGFLVSNLEAGLHAGEVRIAAELAEASVLRDELKDFGRKVSEAGRVTYNARAGKHDDLILAVCIALYVATNRNHASVEELRI